MGLFSRDEPVIYFDDQVVDDAGVIWPAWTDDDGVLWIDVEEGWEVPVTGAIVGGVICPAWIDEAGRLQIETD